MKTKLIGSCIAIALALFACAAPTEAELESGAQAADERTGEVASELRPRLGAGCATTCASDDGAQTCCCAVGDKCIKGITYCKCEKQSFTLTPVAPKFGAAAAP